MKFSPHPFSLRQLQYAVAVADELSFRQAAARCRVSQPSLSAQVAQLEEALGVVLFERNRQRVLVTAAGSELLARARRLLVEADDLGAAGQRAGDPLAGAIRVGVIPTIAPYLLPAATPRLRAGFPRLTLAWHEGRTDGLMASLAAGDLDAALVALEASLGDVEHEVIAVDPFVLAARAGHPLARGSGAVESAELRGLDVMLLDDGHCFRQQALDVCSAARAREGEFRATSLTTLVQMVAGGAGVTLLPALSLATEARRARLSIRPLASPAARRTIALVWRRQAPMAPALRQIAAVLRASFPAPPAAAAPARQPLRRRG